MRRMIGKIYPQATLYEAGSLGFRRVKAIYGGLQSCE
jgi:hypothetical protein